MIISAWTIDGKLFVKTSPDGAPIRIYDEDLTKEGITDWTAERWNSKIGLFLKNLVFVNFVLIRFFCRLLLLLL